jgi:hypothetical protein
VPTRSGLGSDVTRFAEALKRLEGPMVLGAVRQTADGAAAGIDRLRAYRGDEARDASGGEDSRQLFAVPGAGSGRRPAG